MILAIVGPTSVGKTKLSVELAKRFQGEIINADSTQIYQGMDIATAKVTEEEKEGIPHHLFDIKELTEGYTLYDYQKDCRNKIAEIESRHHVPILVGGTGLYIKAALYDYQLEEEQVHRKYEEPTEVLYQMLLSFDPKTTIHPHNRQRIERALNYYQEHQSSIHQKKKATTPIYPCCLIGLTTEREQLYERINQRVYQMLEQGLLEEAKSIYDSHIRTKAVLTPIGYKELFPYFEGVSTLEAGISEIQKNSRHYAKRQYTWFRNQMDVTWFSVHYEDFSKTVEEVATFVQNLTIKEKR